MSLCCCEGAVVVVASVRLALEQCLLLQRAFVPSLVWTEPGSEGTDVLSTLYLRPDVLRALDVCTQCCVFLFPSFLCFSLQHVVDDIPCVRRAWC